MNIHPIFVHFPVALFTLYAVAELVRAKKLAERSEWFFFKVGLLFLGVLSSFAAAFTGNIAKGIVRTPDNSALISLHENFAETTIIIFCVLAAAYIVALLRRSNLAAKWEAAPSSRSVWLFFVSLERFFVETPFVYILVLAGLLCVTVTGALGGSIIYGPEGDALTSAIYHFFFH